MKRALYLSIAIFLLTSCGTNTVQPPYDVTSQSACQQLPCKNAGTCIDVATYPGYQCNCTPNWQGPTCEQAKQVCNANESYCQNNVLLTCNSAGTALSQLNCQQGCINNICKTGCVQGQNLCLNNTQLQVCGAGGQVSLQNCPNGCQNNQCLGGGQKICNANESFCQNNILFTCKPDGTEWVQIACPNGCQNSVCKGNCQPGTQSCQNQKQLQLCDINGNITLKTCAGFCQNNQCSEDAPLCTPNTQFCSQGGKDIYLCAADGKSASPIKTCPFGCDPQTLNCKSSSCQIGETRCAPDNPNYVETCLPDQSGWQKAPTPCKDGCSNGTCFEPVCGAGQKKCGSQGIVICKQDKSGWQTIEECDGGCLIDGNGQPFCGACIPGSKKCQGSQIMSCINATQGWSVQSDCASATGGPCCIAKETPGCPGNAAIEQCVCDLDSYCCDNKWDDLCLDKLGSCGASCLGQACAGGECISAVTMDASNSKEQNYKLLIETMGNCLHIGITGVCNGINTLSISYGIKENDLSDWFCASYEDDTFKASFGNFEAALDVMGCEGFLTNVSDLTIEGGAIFPGKNGQQCIGFSKGTINGKEVIVDSCSNF